MNHLDYLEGMGMTVSEWEKSTNNLAQELVDVLRNYNHTHRSQSRNPHAQDRWEAGRCAGGQRTRYYQGRRPKPDAARSSRGEGGYMMR